MRRILILAAIGEALTGLLLVLVPSLIAGLLLGTDLTGPGVIVARVAGIALIGLAAACWPGPASLGMLVYGLLVTPYLVWLGLTLPTPGILLWPVAILHAALTVVFALDQVRRRSPPNP
jgi:hypothetical protein